MSLDLRAECKPCLASLWKLRCKVISSYESYDACFSRRHFSQGVIFLKGSRRHFSRLARRAITLRLVISAHASEQCATDVNSSADRRGVNMRDTRGMAGTKAAEANNGSGAHPEGKRSGGALTANAALPTLSGDGASNQRSAHRTERSAHSEIGGGSGGDTTGTCGDLGAVVQAGSSGGGSSSAMMGCGAEAVKMKGKRALQG